MSDKLVAGVVLSESNLEALEELRGKFASVARGEIGVSRFDWRALMEAGALASLSVSRYRGTKALTAGDLGLALEEMEEINSIVELGHRLLLPREVLNSFNTIETRARQVLRSYGLLTVLGLFLPAASYTACATALQAYKLKFEDTVELLVANLPTHRDRMVEEYYKLARQVRERLDRANLLSGSRWDFEENFVERCMATFPTVEELRAAFAFGLKLEFVPLPYQSQTEQPNYTAASDDLLALRREVIAQQQQARERVVGEFVTGVQAELFGLVNTALEDTLTSIKSNGNLQARSVVQLKNLVEKISTLNFWQDKRLETIQAEISALVGNSGKRDTQLSTALLEELQYQTKLVLVGLAQPERGGLQLEQQAAPASGLQLANPSNNKPLQLPAGVKEIGFVSTAEIANAQPRVLTEAEALEREEILRKLGAGSGGVALVGNKRGSKLF